MKRDYKLFINDIKECVQQIEEYLGKTSEEQFMKSKILQDAVIRRFEIMGEAVKHIPRSLKEKNKDFPWSSVSQFRDLVAHSYYEFSLNRIWKSYKEDLPKIKQSLKDIKLV